jgi:hypothetical protein
MDQWESDVYLQLDYTVKRERRYGGCPSTLKVVRLANSRCHMAHVPTGGTGLGKQSPRQALVSGYELFPSRE